MNYHHERFRKLSKSFTVVIQPLSTRLIKPNFHQKMVEDIIGAFEFCFRLDEVENAAEVNANLSKTLKNREEKIENLKARLGFAQFEKRRGLVS